MFAEPDLSSGLQGMHALRGTDRGARGLLHDYYELRRLRHRERLRDAFTDNASGVWIASRHEDGDAFVYVVVSLDDGRRLWVALARFVVLEVFSPKRRTHTRYWTDVGNTIHVHDFEEGQGNVWVLNEVAEWMNNSAELGVYDPEMFVTFMGKAEQRLLAYITHSIYEHEDEDDAFLAPMRSAVERLQQTIQHTRSVMEETERALALAGSIDVGTEYYGGKKKKTKTKTKTNKPSPLNTPTA